MNRIYRLVFNRTLGLFQVAPETARAHGKSGRTVSRARKLTLVAAMTVTLPVWAYPSGIIGVPGADNMAAGPGGDGETAIVGVGALNPGNNVRGGYGGSGGQGITGAPGINTQPGFAGLVGGIGGNGGAGVDGTEYELINQASYTIKGGAGGVGGIGGFGGSGGFGMAPASGGTGGTGGSGAQGGDGGAAVSGTGFTVTNAGTLQGGIGGNGGSGGNGGNGGMGASGMSTGAGPGGNGVNGGNGGGGGGGGTAGDGGAAVSGSQFIVNNTGTILGGNGGTAGDGGAGGAGGTGGAGGAGGSAGFPPISFPDGARGNDGSAGNAGTIGQNGNGAAAIIATGDSTVINSGSIAAGMNGDGTTRAANAIEFSGGGNTLELRTGSTITGNVVSTSGATNGGDTLALGGTALNDSFDIANINDQYQGFANFNKVGTGTWTLTGQSDFDGNMKIAAGTLVLDSAAFGMSPTVSVQSGGTLSVNNGNIGALSNAGTVSINAAKTLWVAGDFTNTGTLRINLTDIGTYGQMSVMHTAHLGGTLYINVIGNPALTIGDSLANIIEAGVAIQGAFDRITDNSRLFDFAPVSDPTHFGLEIVKAKDVSAEAIVTGRGNSVARPAAHVLDRIIAAVPDSDLAARFIPISGDRQVSDAVTQTLPLLAGGSQFAAGAAQTGINRVVQARLDSNQGLSSGDEFLKDNHLWLKGFGSWADQNDRNGVSGYDANVGGLAIGMDGKFSDKLLLGASFAYANASVDSNSDVAPNKVDVDVYQLIGYGSYGLDNATEINFQLGAGVNKNQGKRDLSLFDLTAKADYSSVTALAGVGVGHTFTLNEQLRFTPSVRADYSWIKDKGYTEEGADALNLKVKSRDTDSLILAVDGKLNYAFNAATNIGANLGVGYDTLNDRTSITSAYAGAPGAAFTTEGLDLDPWLLRAGVGLTHVVENGTEISLRYDAEKRNSFLNQTASVKVRWAF